MNNNHQTLKKKLAQELVDFFTINYILHGLLIYNSQWNTNDLSLVRPIFSQN